MCIKNINIGRKELPNHGNGSSWVSLVCQQIQTLPPWPNVHIENRQPFMLLPDVRLRIQVQKSRDGY